MTVGQPADEASIAYFHNTVGDRDAFASLYKALKDNAHRDGEIVFMFHPYDFSNYSFEDLDKLLKEISSMPDVQCMTFSQLVNEGITSDRARVQANIEVNLLSKLLRTKTIILPTRTAKLIRIANVLLYLLLSCLMCYVLNCVSKTLSKRKMQLTVLCMALSMVFVIACIWFHCWTPMKTLLGVIIIPTIWLIISLIVNRNSNI